MYSLNIGFPSLLDLGLFQILFEIHSFSNNNIVFQAEAEYFLFFSRF